MRGWFLALGLALLSVARAAVQSVPFAEAGQVIASMPRVVVLYTAEGCRLCELFAPEFLGAVEAVGEKSDIPFLTVDLTEVDGEDITAAGIRRVPLVMLHVDGVEAVFNGAYSKESLVYEVLTAVGEEAGSPASPLEDPTDALRRVFWRGTPSGLTPPTLVGFFAPSADSGPEERAALDDAYARWLVLARRVAGPYRVFETASPAVAERLLAPVGRPVVRLVWGTDEREVTFEEPWTPEEVESAIGQYVVPRVAFVDHRSIRRYQAYKHVLVHVFVAPAAADELSDEGREVATAMRTVAEFLLRKEILPRGNFTIAVSDGEKYYQWMEEFNITPDMLPALAIADNRPAAPYGEAFSYGPIGDNIVSEVQEYVKLAARGAIAPIPTGKPPSEKDIEAAFAPAQQEAARILAESASKDEL